MTPMDNFYRPPGGDPGEHQPTEQFWHGQLTPPGSQGPGYGYPRQQPGLQAHLVTDRRKAWHWAVGVTLAVLLAGGGVIAGISLGSPSLSAAPTASTATSGGGGTGTGSTGTGGTGSQAALLNSTLNAAASPDAAGATAGAGAAASASAPGAGTAAVTTPAIRRCAQLARAARAARLTGHPPLSAAARAATARCRFIRRRIVRFFLLRGIDGQFSIRTPTGAIRTLAYQRGVIESVTSGSAIAVKAADGTIWTWELVSNTVVRDGSGKISESTLAVGERVWVGGPVVSGARDARLIFVRPPSS
jgi:hypothetical protein